ncbi:hypothetical protein [uncultured Methanolobus sp.]|uniref:DUF7544 domain-containing protein n=1 Tax=uncultured Methanolobus sp. TaxID=218300 RepID=UPI002AAB20C8|nr:hypothetical protein [uncultured Methanolobus sp.]
MSWYVIDVIDKAMERTRTFLFEPFNFTKWLKLALIVFFIGGSGGFNSGNGSSYRSSGDESDVSWIPDSFNDFISNLSHHISSYSDTTMLITIALVLLLIFVIVIILGYIGSTMEFVLVESLVSNDVRVREYFKKFMGKGLALYILRIILFLLYILVIIAVMVPFISQLDSDFDFLQNMGLIIAMVLSVLVVIVIMSILLSIITSFINMAIPVSMYQSSGLFSAIGSVFRQFRVDWKQIFIYWIGRGILGITVAIMAGIIGLIILVILLLILGFIDLGVYFILNMILSGTVLWPLLISIVIVELLILSFVSAIIRMPFAVFMKYHMLSFLELWYPLKIPMFDEQHSVSGNSSGQLPEESVVSEE